MTSTLKMAVLIGLTSVGFGGCVSPQGNLQPDFGVALRRNVVAQISDPDARYRRTSLPAASGARSVLSQERYNKDAVIPPATTGASNIGPAAPSSAPPSGK